MYDILPRNLPLLVTIPMKSYDDLQRFKEKTQTNHIEFKDMSEQTKNSDSADWAIIKQLMNDSTTPTLGNGQTINVAAPQPIAEDTFSLDAAPVEARPHVPARPLSPATAPRAAAFVAAQPADVGSRSLLESISASLKPEPQNLTPLPAAQPASLSARPAARHADPMETPRFRQLFSTSSEVTTLSKDTLLQPLLERIASCR